MFLTAIVTVVSQATSTQVASVFTQASSFVDFGSKLVIVVAGAIGIYKLCTGGFGFMKAIKKVNLFVDRVDVMVDSFWPEILSGLEKKDLISTGSTARWASIQAKVLKAQSPMSITPAGNKILEDIKFADVYSSKSVKILEEIKGKLAGKSNIAELDIEQASLQVGAELFDRDDSMLAEAKKYLYEHPALPIAQLKVLIGIFIRDQILNNPETKTKVVANN